LEFSVAEGRSFAFSRAAVYSMARRPCRHYTVVRQIWRRATQIIQGDAMPRYLTFHTLACLTRQGAEELAKRLASASEVKARRVQVNMIEGKMLVEFEAADRESLEKWLEGNGFHYDWLLRVEWEGEGGRLVAV